MNEAAPDFDAEAFLAARNDCPLNGLEIDLARLIWHFPEIAKTVGPILAGTCAIDPRLKALHNAVISAKTRRELRDLLVLASVSLPDVAVLVASVDERELLDQPDRALEIARELAVQRLRAQVLAAGAAGDFDTLESDFAALKSRMALVGEDATHPFNFRVLRAPQDLPRRQWLYGTAYLRECVSALVAPGGTAKSMIAIVEALAMAAGRGLLQVKKVTRCRVLYWNLEDPLDEIERRFAAVAMHFGIRPDEYEDRLFFESGHDTPLKIAAADRSGFRLNDGALTTLRQTIASLGIDVVVIDPLVSAHGVPENDNNAIDAVIKAFAAVAAQTNCAILLVHHARKSLAGQSRELAADDARGAAAFVDGCRIVRLAQRMTEGDADALGIEHNERWRFIRIVDGKVNHAPPAEDSKWVELRSVPLGNGGEDDPNGDWIGVPIPWKPPGLTEGLPGNIVDLVQAKARGAKYRYNQRATRWFGLAIASLCNINSQDKSGRKRLVKLIDTWIENDALVIVEKNDDSRRPVKFVGVPGANDPDDAADSGDAYSSAKNGE